MRKNPTKHRKLFIADSSGDTLRQNGYCRPGKEDHVLEKSHRQPFCLNVALADYFNALQIELIDLREDTLSGDKITVKSCDMPENTDQQENVMTSG